MVATTYRQKLKDPRWQKVRLKVFERDHWRCQHCGASERELQVHHDDYQPHREPWEYPLAALVTLCVTCHERVSTPLVRLTPMSDLARAMAAEGSQPAGTDSPGLIRTGFTALDSLLTGLRPGLCYLLAGRPGMGMTRLALQLLLHHGIESKKPGIFYSLRVSGHEQVSHVLALLGQVDGRRLLTGRLDEVERWRVQAAVARLTSHSFYIGADTPMSVSLIREQLEQLDTPVGLVVIDALSLLPEPDDPGRLGSGRVWALKQIAMQVQAPLLVMDTLTRHLERHADKRPVISDLKDNRDRYADVVLFLYRDVMYHPDTAEPALAEVIVAKNTTGPLGTVRLSFNPRWGQFEKWPTENVVASKDDGN